MPAPRLSIAIAALIAATLASAAHAQSDGTPKGVNPKDNITKVDLIYKHDSLEGGVDIHSLSFKYDRALTAKWGANLELPLLRFEGPGLSESGIGDMLFRIRYVENFGATAVIAAAEGVAPTASEDILGAGKWQLNPVIGAVVNLTPAVFVFGGYKHLRSIAGDSDRPGINQSQPRLLLAKVSPKGWWLMGDLKYTYDHRADTKALDTEIEAGTMLTRQVALSGRIGTSSLDSTRKSTFGLNLRYIF